MAAMNIQVARPADAPIVCAVLQEAAEWLASGGRALWSAAEIGPERVLRDTRAGLFYIAREGVQVAGVVKFELEDAHFWPEVAQGSSAYVHKLAVRRAWAKQGVSAQLLAYARDRARCLGRAHLRLDCVADRQGLRHLYEAFGFQLHSVIRIGRSSHARYELGTLASR